MATIFVSKHRKKILYYITAFSIILFIFQVFHHYKLEKKTLAKGEQFAEKSTDQIQLNPSRNHEMDYNMPKPAERRHCTTVSIFELWKTHP